MRFDELFLSPAVIESVKWPAFENAGIEVVVLREDLRHPVAGGNKSWKLRHNLSAFIPSGKSGILSFGGAFSNHLIALSTACEWMGIPFHAVVRGEERPTNSRILQMVRQGTHIHYCSRSDYRKRNDGSALRDLLLSMGEHVPDPDQLMVIPEGGDNELGLKGCAEMARLIPENTDQIWIACGTGCTLLGLRNGLHESVATVGVPVLRNATALAERIKSAKASGLPWRIVEGYEEGGYGKSSPRLKAFLEEFQHMTGIPLEPVYTGKLFFALHEETNAGRIRSGTRIAVLHSGGIFGD